MDKLTRDDLRRLGYYETSDSRTRKLCVSESIRFAKMGNPLAGLYEPYRGAKWHAVYQPSTSNSRRQLQLFDDPISAAVWLNVELAGE